MYSSASDEKLRIDCILEESRPRLAEGWFAVPAALTTIKGPQAAPFIDHHTHTGALVTHPELPTRRITTLTLTYWTSL